MLELTEQLIELLNTEWN